MTKDKTDEPIPFPPHSEDTEPNDSSAEEEVTPPPYVMVTINTDPETGTFSYGLHVDDRINPITMAGIGWWLQFLAEENIIQGTAQAMERAARAAAMDPKRKIHLPGYKDNPLS